MSIRDQEQRQKEVDRNKRQAMLEGERRMKRLSQHADEVTKKADAKQRSARDRMKEAEDRADRAVKRIEGTNR